MKRMQTTIRRRASKVVLSFCLCFASAGLSTPHVGLFPAHLHDTGPLARKPVPQITESRQEEAVRARVNETYGKLPLSFEANRGQTDPQVKFIARGGRQTIFLTATEAVVVATKQEASTREPFARRKSAPPEPVTGTTLRINFVGMNKKPRVIGLDELPGKANHFRGNDPTQWRTNVPTYAKVRYENVYPGVDLVYYGTGGQLEYDFVVRAGADPSRIMLAFTGADHLEVDDHGDLLLQTAAGTIRQRKPVIYQERDGARTQIPGAYLLTDRKHVAFQFAAYDASRTLVIDPVLDYSTYLGGNNVEWCRAIAVDAGGNAYVTGVTSSTNFPTSAGAFQTCCYGDAFVTKLNSSGSALIYSTYLGGNAQEETTGITVDALGNAYVTGWVVGSWGFPTTPGAFQTTNGGDVDAFVTKLNPTGSALLYSTYLGGGAWDFGKGISVDVSGNAYITGATSWMNFPTTAGAFQTTFAGGSTLWMGDAFVTKLNPSGSALIYSTYLGGGSPDMGVSIAVDAGGNAYVTGETRSANFPTTAGAFQSTYGGGNQHGGDAFVTKLNSSGSALVYSTYLGGGSIDIGTAIVVDPSGIAYVTGWTDSWNFPATPGALQTGYGGGLDDAFVTKLNSTGSSLLYSTFLGGNGWDQAAGIRIDASGNAYLTGFTDSNFPTTADALQTAPGGATDAFVAKLNSTGSSLLYSTYLGGSGSDYGAGIALDAAGYAYVTGNAGSGFPTTPGAFQTTHGGSHSGYPGDGFVSKILVDTGYEIVSHRVFVPASSLANVNVTCSSGKKVLGGGFQIETPVFVQVFSSAPTDGLGNLSDHRWNVAVQNTDPNNARQVTVSAICASGSLLTGYQTVLNSALVPAYSVTNVNVACSSGNKVLGGGFSIENPAFMQALSSEPSDIMGNLSDGFWNVAAQNDSNNAWQARAVAICASGASASVLAGYETVSNLVSIPAPGFASANVPCSSGKRVLGGGFRSSGQTILDGRRIRTFLRIFSSEPTDRFFNGSERHWNVFTENTDSKNARQVLVSAICAEL